MAYKMLRNHEQILSKIATSDGHGENSAFFDGWKAYDTDPYHPTKNPLGVIQMGLAENQLSFDLVQEWVLNNPNASICTPEGANQFKDIAIFQDYHGLPEFRKVYLKHLICDEIYSATVFSQPSFISIAEVVEKNPNCDLELVHIVYSLSKDLGFPGFRVGIIYSYNQSVINCARKMSSFGLVSTQTQYLISKMLNDDVFVDGLINESAKRLGKRHGVLSRGLAQVGIGSLKSNSGLFCWMDLRRLLKEATFDSELELWRVIIDEVKINVSPGASFHCSEPGWFRVCFANMDDETMMVALNRIVKFVIQSKGVNDVASQPCGGRRMRSKLEISLSFRRLDAIMMSPHKMSPHSPLPSPLVRART